MQTNLDAKTVEGFGEEWSRFDQAELDEAELREEFERYFKVFPWNILPGDAVGFDMGCGSGRWAKIAAERCGTLHCIDASEAALSVAKQNLAGIDNAVFHRASVEAIPLDDGSMDFGYSLGVLHHVPDTAEGMRSCVSKLKANAPFLVYLYYAFDNRPIWFRIIWRFSDIFRGIICGLPFRAKAFITDIIAVLIYFPFAKLSLTLEKLGLEVDVLPLSAYRKHSFYTMRTDALDRFGTRLEQRFTRQQITAMMEDAGLERVEFSDQVPYWCAVGFKADDAKKVIGHIAVL